MLTEPESQPLSDKQCQAIRESTARLNIWQGAVRSGKTFSSLAKLIVLLRKGPPGHVMLVGVTRDSIQRNVIIELCQMIGARIPGSKSTEMRLLGRQVYFVGANDESAVRRIQGSTLAIAYVDEATCIPEPFWNMLLSRLSVPGAQLLATLNPEGPAHWLKVKFLDRANQLDLKTWKFTLDDNPILTKEYVDNLKAEYSGMWYNRYILGEWAVAQGLIYGAFDSDNIYSEEVLNPNYKIVGIDYGSTNPTAAVLVGCNPKQWPQVRVMDMYYFDSSQALRGKTDAELADEIEEWLKPHSITHIYVDPSAKSFKLELLQRDLPVCDADNDVIPGIQSVARLILGKNLLIHENCKQLITDLQTYAWDPKAANRGVDQPIKVNDHSVDSLRYAVHSQFPGGDLGVEDKDYSVEAVRARYMAESNPMGDFMGADTNYF